MPRKPPSVATWSSYEMPETGPLSVASIQFRTTGPAEGLVTWISTLEGVTATGSDGGSWSLRKSGLLALSKASTQVLAVAGYEFENTSSTLQRQSKPPLAGAVKFTVWTPWAPNG